MLFGNVKAIALVEKEAPLSPVRVHIAGSVVQCARLMKSITVDTHKVITSLQRRGFTREQAEGLVEAAQEVDLSELATRADIRVIEARLNMLSVIGTGIFIAVIVNIIMSGG